MSTEAVALQYKSVYCMVVVTVIHFTLTAIIFGRLNSGLKNKEI
jgi:tRNA C32,U32 (ribose-2'-O)-methylase TrmJ